MTKYAMLVAMISVGMSTSHAMAQEALSPTQPQQRIELSLQMTPQAEMAGINHQQWLAHGLYVTSTLLAVGGTALMAFGVVLLYAGPYYTGPEMMIGSAPFLLGHIVTMAIGAGLDFGSASHRRKLLAAHPELSFELTPAGLGVAIHF